MLTRHPQRFSPQLVQIAYSIYRARLPLQVGLSALTLLRRLKTRFPGSTGSSGHRLWLCSYMISSKALCDDTYSNRSWSTCGMGMFSIAEVNQMEVRRPAGVSLMQLEVVLALILSNLLTLASSSARCCNTWDGTLTVAPRISSLCRSVHRPAPSPLPVSPAFSLKRRSYSSGSPRYPLHLLCQTLSHSRSALTPLLPIFFLVFPLAIHRLLPIPARLASPNLYSIIHQQPSCSLHLLYIRFLSRLHSPLAI
jgi:hypothetical protein